MFCTNQDHFKRWELIRSLHPSHAKSIKGCLRLNHISGSVIANGSSWNWAPVFPRTLVQIKFSRADVRVVYFRRFGLNISDLQREHMLRGATATDHVPVTLAAEKEAEQSSLELRPDRLQSQPVDRPRSFSVKTPTLKQALALRPVDPNAVSSSASTTVGQSGRELT